MQPSLQAPASVNVTLALPSSPLCSSRWRAALPRGLALHQSTAGQFRYTGDPFSNTVNSGTRIGPTCMLRSGQKASSLKLLVPATAASSHCLRRDLFKLIQIMGRIRRTACQHWY